MRTIKFLGIAVALAAAAVTANAQGGRRFDHFTGLNDLARLEARQIERHQVKRQQIKRHQVKRQQIKRQHLRRFAMARAQRMGQVRGMARTGMRAGMRANATPEQKVFATQFGEQRQAIRAKAQAGTLTREQARTQMRAWVAEHRPKK